MSPVLWMHASAMTERRVRFRGSGASTMAVICGSRPRRWTIRVVQMEPGQCRLSRPIDADSDRSLGFVGGDVAGDDLHFGQRRRIGLNASDLRAFAVVGPVPRCYAKHTPLCALVAISTARVRGKIAGSGRSMQQAQPREGGCRDHPLRRGGIRGFSGWLFGMSPSGVKSPSTTRVFRCGSSENFFVAASVEVGRDGTVTRFLWSSHANRSWA